jgi:hypothetical protein
VTVGTITWTDFARLGVAQIGFRWLSLLGIGLVCEDEVLGSH